MNYPSHNIQVLSAIEGLRKRPSFYIGQKGNPETATRLVSRALDFMLLWASFCETKHIHVEVSQEHGVTIRDDGLGLPVEREAFPDGTHPIERWLSEPTQTGRHEIWTAVGLSTSFALETVRAGRMWKLLFRDGELVQRLTNEYPTAERGTTIYFQLDPKYVQHPPDTGSLYTYLASKAPAGLGFDVGRVAR